MQSGYLALETHPDNPGMVRLISNNENPQLHDEPSSGTLRFVLKFHDIEAAFMHAHTAMRHQLVDLNSHLYKKSLAEAMGDLESIQLHHELVWKDPSLTEADMEEMEHEIEHNRKIYSRQEIVVNVIKYVAITLLVFNLLAPLISEIIN